MLILLIETSTERSLVAIGTSSYEVKYHIELPYGYHGSTHLMPYIDKMLEQEGYSLADFGLIAAGVGPGSYTGIRVGAVVAKTLSYASKIPLTGICSLEGFVPTKSGSFAALIDAKIGGVYLQKGFKDSNGLVKWESSPMICSLEQLQNELPDRALIVTPNATRIQPLIEKACANKQLQWEERSPCPSQLIRSAMDRFEKGEISKSCELKLLYLRDTQAEIEKRAKNVSRVSTTENTEFTEREK